MVKSRATNIILVTNKANTILLISDSQTRQIVTILGAFRSVLIIRNGSQLVHFNKVHMMLIYSGDITFWSL